MPENKGSSISYAATMAVPIILALIMGAAIYLSFSLNHEKFKPVKQKYYSRDSLLAEGLTSGIKCDTIIFGFRFGMTYKEVANHAGKINKGNKTIGTFQMPMVLAREILYADITPVFFNDTLRGIDVLISSASDFTKIDSALSAMIEEKYGDKKCFAECVKNKQWYSDHWVRGNLEICIDQHYDNVAMQYRDISNYASQKLFFELTKKVDSLMRVVGESATKSNL